MNDPRSEAEVQEVEAAFYQALRSLHVTGADALLALWSDGEDVSTMNAAGGVERGADAVRQRWTWWASRGVPMPATEIERLAFVATPELAYTVALEHHGARTLRVTHVYRREDAGWKMIHRHADPLVDKQS